MMYIRYIIFTILTLSNIVIAVENHSFFEVVCSKNPSNYIYNIIQNDINITLKDHIISFDEFKKAQAENCMNWDNGILDESKKPKTMFNYGNVYFKQISGKNKSKYDFSDLFVDAFDLNYAVQLKCQNGMVNDINYTGFLAMNLSLDREKRNKYYSISESKNLLKKTFITFSPELISMYNKLVKYTCIFFSFIYDFDFGQMTKKYSLQEKKVIESQFVDTEYIDRRVAKMHVVKEK